MLRDSEVAHDVVQDAFARALVERRRYRGGSLAAWIWAIVVRRALDERRARRLAPFEDALDPELVESARDPAVADAVRSLPPRRRLMVGIELSHFTGSQRFRAAPHVGPVRRAVGAVGKSAQPLGERRRRNTWR